MQRNQFTFYRSFYDALRNIPNKQRRAEMYDMLCEYALDGTEPDGEKLTAIQKATLLLIFPVLDSARKKAAGGAKSKRGGKDTDKIEERYWKDVDNKEEEEAEEEEEKENKKEAEAEIENEEDASFELFWNIFPKKVCKGKAREAFAKVTVPLPVLLEAVRRQSLSMQWQQGEGQFIPNPATWLSEKRWEDQLPGPKEIKASGIMGEFEKEALRLMMES